MRLLFAAALVAVALVPFAPAAEATGSWLCFSKPMSGTMYCCPIPIPGYLDCGYKSCFTWVGPFANCAVTAAEYAYLP